ncbi:phage tail protein [Pseudomonas lurida]|uniref:phage tail protein n=1 Tax=Pseudomonas lurida TaxID=244566 RepID=UPI0034D968BE
MLIIKTVDGLKQVVAPDVDIYEYAAATGGTVMDDSNFVELPRSPEELASDERAWRDAEIERVRWLRDRHRDEMDMGVPRSLSAEQFAGLLLYIQQLRTWPQATGFPDQAARPVPPDWLAVPAQ